MLLVHHVQSCDVLQRYYSSAYRLLQYFGTFTTQPPECQRKLPHKLRVPASGSSSRRKILLLTIAVFFSIPLVWYFSLGKCIIFHLIWRHIQYPALKLVDFWLSLSLLSGIRCVRSANQLQIICNLSSLTYGSLTSLLYQTVDNPSSPAWVQLLMPSHCTFLVRISLFWLPLSCLSLAGLDTAGLHFPSLVLHW